jgi:hypothetical protein
MTAELGALVPHAPEALADVRTGQGFTPGESRYTEAMGARICARVATGMSLNAVCADPALPSKATVAKWAAARPEFAAALAAARDQALRDGGRIVSARLRKRLARLAERGRAEPGPPSAYCDAVGESICRRIAHGEALVDICRDADQPSHVTVNAWARRNPAFAYMLRIAREQQAHLKLDLAWKIARDATPATLGVARLQIQTLRWQAARLAPRLYGEGAPAPPPHPIDAIREDGPDSYWARRRPDLAAKSQGEGDWD